MMLYLVLRGIRHQHPQYLLCLAHNLLARNKPRIAALVLKSLSVADASEFYSERLLLPSRACARLGRMEDAIAAAKLLPARTPGNTTYQRHYEALIVALAAPA